VQVAVLDESLTGNLDAVATTDDTTLHAKLVDEAEVILQRLSRDLSGSFGMA